MNLDPELLEIVVCPACRAALEPREEPPSLRCTGCRRIYPVVEDVPVLLVDEARTEE